MFGTLRKDLSLIDNVTERSVRYMYRITFPPFGIVFCYCFDVPCVGVFSRMKSAGFVSGLGGRFVLVIPFFDCNTCNNYFFDSYPKIFCICNPPCLFGCCLLSRLDRLFHFRLFYYSFVSHPGLSLSVCRFNSSSGDVAIG